MQIPASAFVPGKFLLPSSGTDFAKWACIACDQYTSDPAYWESVQQTVGVARSTYRLMLPEIRLPEADSLIPEVHQAMRQYLSSGFLKAPFESGFILTERAVPAGKRLGLIGCADLKRYSFLNPAQAAIRPTEETIQSRIPPRMKIRMNAPLETSHILLLADDPENLLIRPLYELRAQLPLLYDFDLMLGGGHLRGWAVSGVLADQAQRIMESLITPDGFQFAVGDGNHSLATAKACYNQICQTLSPEEADAHPARYAMCELVNLHDPALTFEPIHRLLKNVSPQELLHDLKAACGGEGPVVVFAAKGLNADVSLAGRDPLAVQTVQRFLDSWLADHPQAEIDYIHGSSAVLEMAARPDCAAVLLPGIRKEEFFPLLRKLGVMPRKTFSLGEADDKRFYLECRQIQSEI